MILSKGRSECKGRFNSKLLFKVGKKIANLSLLLLSNFTYYVFIISYCDELNIQHNGELGVFNKFVTSYTFFTNT